MFENLTITPPTYQLEDAGVAKHQQSVDIVVCVHNALDDVRRCLDSIVQYTDIPYHLIIIDDGSDAETCHYLRDYADKHSVVLLRNEQARGYTRAANQGLRAIKSAYTVLLNSDTVVSPYWLDRLLACAESSPSIGLVGPLSNTASWQSIPKIEHQGDWAANPLPTDMTVTQMAARVAAFSARLYPRLPFLNGFCLFIKKEVIETIGYFDEIAFEQGYGEENDYCIRARQAGWELAVADDVYIYHAQSKSYSHQRRQQLAELGMQALVKKHGQAIIDAGVEVCRHHRVLQGIRIRAELLIERWNLISQAQYYWRGKRVVFVLPVMEIGGGANVVIHEAHAMLRMGIDVYILNFLHHQTGFEQCYSDLSVPVIYARADFEIPELCRDFDAVIATAHNSVEWIAPLAEQPNAPMIAYYIQDFEPYFYVDKPAHYRLFWQSSWLRRRLASYYFRFEPGFREAWISYLRIPNMVLFTKTRWNQTEVEKQIQRSCTIIGASCDIEQFMPRAERTKDGKIRISAMIRPSSSRRGAYRTMQVLRQIQQTFAHQVDIILFGLTIEELKFSQLPADFDFHHLGVCLPTQLAQLFSQIDIFVDFSNYQAMGLTAMEAMACGVAVIVPETGGAESYAIHQKNALLINTHSTKTCYTALSELITNEPLRLSLMTQAYLDMAHFYSEGAAYRILKRLFGQQK
jgi:GT2 family glycosyltransferase/glycosyltransferase involved in cell wall biosynthesis